MKKEEKKGSASESMVVTTKDYGMFKFLKGNRPIVKSKILNLVASFEGGINLFPYCPILVNAEHYVIDGQHRLEACKRMKLAVYYLVIPDFTLRQIASINSTVTKWSMKDYLNCYIETGIGDYKFLHLFKEKYGISLNIAIGLLMDGGVKSNGGSNVNDFKDGLFKINHGEKAEMLMKKVFEYQSFCEFVTERNFIYAIQLLLASPLYKHSAVIEKLSATKPLMVKKDTYKEYIYQIEEMFNHRNSKRQILYSNTK